MSGENGAGGNSGKGGSSRRGGRKNLRERVKTARGRRLSSTRWLERQLNDPYVMRAKEEGYRSRAAFKLLEMDEKYHFLKSGARIVDLGCAPGGWTQVSVARAGSDKGKGKVIGVDLQEIDPVPGADIYVLDFLEAGADDKVKEWPPHQPVINRPTICGSWRWQRPRHTLPMMSCISAAPIAPKFCRAGRSTNC